MDLGSGSVSSLESSPVAFQPGTARPAWPRTAPGNAGLGGWFLTASERGNSTTRLDSRHPDGAACTTGNRVRPLLHGTAYFAELLTGIRALRAGDLLLFTDWRGDPDHINPGHPARLGPTEETR